MTVGDEYLWRVQVVVTFGLPVDQESSKAPEGYIFLRGPSHRRTSVVPSGKLQMQREFQIKNWVTFGLFNFCPLSTTPTLKKKLRSFQTLSAFSSDRASSMGQRLGPDPDTARFLGAVHKT